MYANLKHCKICTCIVAAISAPKPIVRGASWDISTLPVFAADCKIKQGGKILIRHTHTHKDVLEDHNLQHKKNQPLFSIPSMSDHRNCGVGGCKRKE
jgi:hypothetical protein